MDETEVPLDKFVIDFFNETGYGEWDILGFNRKTRIIVTKNGGMYHVLNDGRVQWLKGPPIHVDDRL